MELPITRPSYVSYGDEVDFDKFLEKLARKRHNGFIRITHASSEGHILLKNGTPVAASYDRYMKSEAMKKILEIVDKIDTLIELFEVRRSQIDYLIDINKVYKLEPRSQIDYLIDINKVYKLEPTPPKRLEEIPEAAKPTEKTPTKPEETLEITKETEKEKRTKRPLNREEVMKKYGLADVDEEEIERVLETYKGGAMDHNRYRRK